MAWTYSDWKSQATDALRLTRLRLHIDEVGAAISASVSGAEFNRSPGNLNRYYELLLQQEEKLERRVERASTGLVSRLGTRRATE